MRRKGILNGPLLIIAVAAAVLVGFCSACDTTEPLPGSEAEISVTGYASGAEYLDGDTVPFEDVKDKIRMTLRAQKRELEMQRLADELRKKSFVDIKVSFEGE